VIAVGTGEDEDAEFHAEAPAGGMFRVYHGENQSRLALGDAPGGQYNAGYRS
jgi:hypothetical protein